MGRILGSGLEYRESWNGDSCAWYLHVSFPSRTTCFGQLRKMIFVVLLLERVKRSLTQSLSGFHSCFESGSPCSVALSSPMSEQIVQLISYGKESYLGNWVPEIDKKREIFSLCN